MTDFPSFDMQSCRPCLNTLASEGIGDYAGLGSYSSRVWSTANCALYMPIVVRSIYTVTQITVYNGTVVAGNVDVGVYDDQGNLLTSIGATAQSGTSALQTFDVADVTLRPGRYYVGMVSTDGTATFFTTIVEANASGARQAGVFQQTGQSSLPSTATFAVCTQQNMPQVSLTSRSFV